MTGIRGWLSSSLNVRYELKDDVFYTLTLHRVEVIGMSWNEFQTSGGEKLPYCSRRPIKE